MKILPLLLAVSFFSCDSSQDISASKPIHFDKDSIISAITKDSLYHVTKVEVSPDSTINIHLKDPEDAGSDYYFDKKYNLLNGGYIKEVAIFKKGKFLYSSGFHTGATVKEFEEKNVIGGQIPVINEMIKEGMNDPDSYQHIKTSYYYQMDDTFIVYTDFRGKNLFNATVTNSATAVMNKNGDILKFSIK